MGSNDKQFSSQYFEIVLVLCVVIYLLFFLKTIFFSAVWNTSWIILYSSFVCILPVSLFPNLLLKFLGRLALLVVILMADIRLLQLLILEFHSNNLDEYSSLVKSFIAVIGLHLVGWHIEKDRKAITTLFLHGLVLALVMEKMFRDFSVAHGRF